MDGFKYGLMVYADLDNAESAGIAPNAWTFGSKLESLLEREVIDHWREVVGTLEWEKLTRKSRMVMLRVRSSTAEVLDGENQALQNRLFQLHRALMLAGPNGLVSGKTWFLDGEAGGLSHADPLKTIRTFGQARPVVRPYYCPRDSF